MLFVKNKSIQWLKTTAKVIGCLLTFNFVLADDLLMVEGNENGKIIVQSNQSKEKSIRSLKISIMDDNPPYSVQLSDGQLIGYYVDFWKLWSKSNQIPIEFSVGSYNENIKSTREGLVDFHSGLFAYKNRKKWADFSISFDRIDTGLFYLNSHKNKINNILDAKGLNVAVQPFTYQVENLPKKYPEINFVSVQTIDELIEKLISGELDVIIGEVPFLRSYFERYKVQGAVNLANKLVMSNNVHALVPKGHKDTLQLINQGIRHIPSDKLSRLSQKWFPTKKPYNELKIEHSIGLTKTEVEWLESIGDLNLGIGKYWYPVEYIDENNQHQGMSSDYINLLERQLRLNLSFDHRLGWIEVIDKIKTKEIDFLSAVGITKKRSEYLTFTDPYMSFALVIVVKKNTIYVQGPHDLEGYKVGTARSSPIVSTWKNIYPKIPIQEMSSSRAGLEALESGEIDAYIANSATIYQKLKNTYINLEVVAVTPHNLDIAMGVRKGLEPFIPILNKFLKNISQKNKLKIRKNWLGTELKQGVALWDYIFQWLPYLLFLFFITAFVIIRNKKLMHEINKSINVEKALEKAKQKSKIANLNKEQFLANMSHEVRTPINALVGSSHLLEMSGLNEEQQSYIQTMNYSASSLLLLVNDIADFTRIESDQLTLENEDFKLTDLLNNIISQAKINLVAKDLLITYDINSNVPDLFMGDQQRLGQIITNLLSNAIKFTDKGSVKLSVSLMDEAVENVIKTLRFEMVDTGIGMDEKQKSKLFKAYSQASESISREYGGTGLGLKISKKLCELMHGGISVKSELGIGSRFVFTVKLLHSLDVNGVELDEKEKNRISDSEIKNKLKNKKVLIVDDNMVNLMIAKKILLNYKMLVSVCKNGKEAIVEVVDNNFDVILMDIQMPEMDGYETTQYIRDELGMPNIPIIALSANVMAKDKILSKQAGMNEHLAKPIKVDDLVESLSRYL